MMTDEEYRRLLTALVGKHLRIPPSGPDFSLQGLQADLDRISAASRHLMALRHEGDTEQLNRVVGNLEEIRPVLLAKQYMTACGILDALDDAPDLVLGELR